METASLDLCPSMDGEGVMTIDEILLGGAIADILVR
jgi:hypothetical protein